MASISFVSPDGTESSFQLVKSRPVQIGRDPGNDVVLRDPRVSRMHAEVMFERGFFVIRDLGSANGTMVNGQKIRAAPLTNNAELRMGNSIGRFVDSPTEMDPSDTLSVDLFKSTAVDEESDELEIRERDSLQRKVSLPAVDGPPDDDGPFPEAGPPSTTSDQGVAPEGGSARQQDRSRALLRDRFIIDVGPSFGDHSVIRDSEGRTLFYYHRPANVTGFIAGFVAALIFVSGSAIAIFLLTTRAFLAAFLTATVTLSIALLLLVLVPRRKQVQICSDPEGTLALSLRQETHFSFPTVRFSLREADGGVICLFARSFGSVLGPHRWSIEEGGMRSAPAVAVEHPALAALLRKIAGPLFGLLRTDFWIFAGEVPAGAILRRNRLVDQILLDLTADARGQIDRRMALGLAVAIDVMERK